MTGKNFSENSMNILFIKIKATKKACISRLSLVEVASLQAKIFGFMANCLVMSRILRGNTKALKKLLLHTSNTSVAFSVQEVKALQV